jgi:hypothetical protein
VIADDEEIIGIHGNRYGHQQYFATIGFIVWKPPKGNKEFLKRRKSEQIEMYGLFDNSPLDVAIASMRKLPVYGYTANGAHVPDYEWPTAADIRAMPVNPQEAIKAVAINWKKCDQIATVWGGV